MEGAPPQYESELGTVLQVMSGLEYARPEDVARIPVMGRQVKYAIYAPLASAEAAPDVVVLFANARRSLALTEALAQVDGENAPAMGRPACAAIPQAVNSGRAAMSLGCCGARAYVSALSDDAAMWALPGAKIEAYAARVEILAKANDLLGQFHELRKSDVAAGARPTYAESMARLQGSRG
jgi:uncharacterized protein (DUF169 family)